jgi:hypothetical protein
VDVLDLRWAEADIADARACELPNVIKLSENRVSKKFRVCHLQCESAAERDEWLAALRAAARGGGRRI